jgi:CDP-diacylglycerol--glycerol-3-phosphate 3-phosphatidyltransferase
MTDRPRLTTLPNLLGLARIALTPVVMALLLFPFPGSGMWAFVIFLAAGLSDFVDGWLARRRNQVSTLGVFLDLTADKVLVAGVLVVLVEVGLLPSWLVAILLIREFVVGGIRQLAASEQVVVSAQFLGKAKTVFTLVAICALLLAFDAAQGGPSTAIGSAAGWQFFGFVTMVAAAILSLASGWIYFRGALPLLLGSGDSPT